MQSIRSNTAYPTYRGFIGMIEILGYLMAGATGLLTVIAALSSMSTSFMLGLGILVFGGILAAIYFFAARFFKEASLILADMGDSIMEANSRGSMNQ